MIGGRRTVPTPQTPLEISASARPTIPSRNRRVYDSAESSRSGLRVMVSPSSAAAHGAGDVHRRGLGRQGLDSQQESRRQCEGPTQFRLSSPRCLFSFSDSNFSPARACRSRYCSRRRNSALAHCFGSCDPSPTTSDPVVTSFILPVDSTYSLSLFPSYLSTCEHVDAAPSAQPLTVSCQVDRY